MTLMDSAEKISDIKQVGVVLRPSSPQLKDYFFSVKEMFEKKGITVQIDSVSGGMIGVFGQEFTTLCQESDLLISIGGDGTLISVVRRSFGHQIPIMGINMGNLGFLTDIQKDEVESFIEKLLIGDYRVDKRMLIEATLHTAEGDKKRFAFNDAVITRKHLTKMVHIRAYIDKEPFNTYYGDGLIIATPTGSTAYNISSGGPVVYPFSQIFVITPICPHSLTQRPLVLPAEFKIDLEVEDNEAAIIVFDGQEMENLNPGETISIQIAKEHAKLIHRVERNYFRVLRDKFHWGSL